MKTKLLALLALIVGLVVAVWGCTAIWVGVEAFSKYFGHPLLWIVGGLIVAIVAAIVLIPGETLKI